MQALAASCEELRARTGNPPLKRVFGPGVGLTNAGEYIPPGGGNSAQGSDYVYRYHQGTVNQSDGFDIFEASEK